MNLGSVSGVTYIKHIDESKAVLWKFRELSIRTKLFAQLKENGIKHLLYVTRRHGTWKFDLADVDLNKKWRKVGQEEQYYFSIDLRISSTSS